MTFKAMILPDGTLRLVTPVDLKESVGEKITIELVGIAEEEEHFFSNASLPTLEDIWENEPDNVFGKPIR